MREIRESGGSVEPAARVTTAENDSHNRHYFQQQIIEVAKLFDHFANVQDYRSRVRLAIPVEDTFEIVISIHGYGPSGSGLMAASAFSAKRVKRDSGGNRTCRYNALCDGSFSV